MPQVMQPWIFILFQNNNKDLFCNIYIFNITVFFKVTFKKYEFMHKGNFLEISASKILFKKI